MSKSKRKQPLSFAGPRFFGIDLAKRESQLCAMDAEGKIIEERRFPTPVKELEQIAAQLTRRDTVTFEMTTNSFATRISSVDRFPYALKTHVVFDLNSTRRNQETRVLFYLTTSP